MNKTTSFKPRKGIGSPAWKNPAGAQEAARRGLADQGRAESSMIVRGDPDLWKTLQQVKNEAEGWMKTTRAMEIPGEGCLIQSCTRKKDSNGRTSFSEAMQFVPGVKPVRAGEFWKLAPLG